MLGGGRGLGDARLMGLRTSSILPPEKAMDNWLGGVVAAVPVGEGVTPETGPNSSVGVVSG